MSDCVIVIRRGVSVDAETKHILGAAIPGTGGDEVVIVLLDVMYAKAANDDDAGDAGTSPRGGRQRVAKGESASPGYATHDHASPRSGRQRSPERVREPLVRNARPRKPAQRATA